MKVLLIDANIYLRFFDSNQKEFKKLLDFLLKIENDLFITKQIVDEVGRNKLSVFGKSIINYKKNINFDTVLLPEHFATDSNNYDIISWNKKRKELENNNLHLSEELEAIFTENLNKISSSTDYVSLKLKSIFKNQIKETEEQFLRAKNRKEIGNPPGKQNDSLGDQITWEQFLNKIQTVEETWIISNDFDYFTQYNKGIYLNAFLFAELVDKNPNLKINCFSRLSDGLKSYFAKSDQENFIRKEEFEEISKEEKLYNRIPIASSNIASVGYDEDIQTLEIEFLNGSVYQYFDVPANIYQGMMTSESHGQYFAQQIKGHYRYIKV
jgi:hypothetical protein